MKFATPQGCGGDEAGRAGGLKPGLARTGCRGSPCGESPGRRPMGGAGAAGPQTSLEPLQRVRQPAQSHMEYVTGLLRMCLGVAGV